MILLDSILRQILIEAMTSQQAIAIFASVGVPNAGTLSHEDLKKTRNTLATKYHPDSGNTTDATKMQYINAAYDILKTQRGSTGHTGHTQTDDSGWHKKQTSADDIWNTYKHGMSDPVPKKGTVNYYKKWAWEISGKPNTTESNIYTFYNWDGYYFRGQFSVYAVPAKFFEISKGLVELDSDAHRSKAIFVASTKNPKDLLLINLNGKDVSASNTIYTHDAFNNNPSNDRLFVDKLRKSI
jgi:hypothetical protein